MTSFDLTTYTGVTARISSGVAGEACYNAEDVEQVSPDEFHVHAMKTNGLSKSVECYAMVSIRGTTRRRVMLEASAAKREWWCDADACYL